MSGIGHNKGPTMERGGGGRRFAWKKARADLLPVMPIEIVRVRVRRAKELGLDYKAYAGIRATTGRDIIALLFSDNALRLLNRETIPEPRLSKLRETKNVDLLALLHPPADPDRFVELYPEISHAGHAPGLQSKWREVRDRVRALKGNLPADGVVVVGETLLERNWSEAAKLAGYIPAERYFGP